MNNEDFFHALEAIAMLANLIVLYVTAKMRSEISELKVHMYEHFVTWRGLRDYNRDRKDER